MEHNYCWSVSTNGWHVGNSVMTECAQVGYNRVLNEWCRLHIHPPTSVQMQVAAAAFRVTEAPGPCFQEVWDKKRVMYTKQQDRKCVAMMIH